MWSRWGRNGWRSVDPAPDRTRSLSKRVASQSLPDSLEPSDMTAYLRAIRLVNFRNYADATALLAPGLNVVVGDNAQGIRTCRRQST